MENTSLQESFIKNWDEFVVEVRGALVNHAEKQRLTYSVASKILSDMLFEWRSDANVISKWLDDLKLSDYEKSVKVSDILFKSVSFENIDVEVNKTANYLPYAPFVISFVALGITWNLNLTFILKLLVYPLALFLPPVLLSKFVKNIQEDFYIKAARNSIPAYINQLDKYKEAILAVL